MSSTLWAVGARATRTHGEDAMRRSSAAAFIMLRSTAYTALALDDASGRLLAHA
jgi:hypothetical protein